MKCRFYNRKTNLHLPLGSLQCGLDLCSEGLYKILHNFLHWIGERLWERAVPSAWDDLVHCPSVKPAHLPADCSGSFPTGRRSQLRDTDRRSNDVLAEQPSVCFLKWYRLEQVRKWISSFYHHKKIIIIIIIRDNNTIIMIMIRINDSNNKISNISNDTIKNETPW